MAKTTRGGGPSFSDEELNDPQPPEVMLRNPPTVDRGDAVPVRFQVGTMTEVGGATSAGSNSGQSSGEEHSSSKRAKRDRPKPAQTTESLSDQSQEGTGSTASSTDGSGQETETESTEDELIPWADESWSYRDLQLECKERGLSASGSQAELVERLEVYDLDTEDE